MKGTVLVEGYRKAGPSYGHVKDVEKADSSNTGSTAGSDDGADEPMNPFATENLFDMSAREGYRDEFSTDWKNPVLPIVGTEDKYLVAVEEIGKSQDEISYKIVDAKYMKDSDPYPNSDTLKLASMNSFGASA